MNREWQLQPNHANVAIHSFKRDARNGFAKPSKKWTNDAAHLEYDAKNQIIMIHNNLRRRKRKKKRRYVTPHIMWLSEKSLFNYFTIICHCLYSTTTKMKVKRKVSSPERQTVNDDHDKDSPAIRPKRKRVRKEEESEGIDLCAK